MTDPVKVPVTDTFGNYLLKGLVEIDQPAAVPFSFEAPGWWVLGGLLIISATYGLWRFLKWRHETRYRREALSELSRLKADGRIEGVPLLLRKTGLAGFGREAVVALTGQRWIEFLNGTVERPVFDGRLGGFLLQLSYGPPGHKAEELNEDLFRGAAHWIERHKRRDAP